MLIKLKESAISECQQELEAIGYSNISKLYTVLDIPEDYVFITADKDLIILSADNLQFALLFTKDEYLILAE